MKIEIIISVMDLRTEETRDVLDTTLSDLCYLTLFYPKHENMFSPIVLRSCGN